MNEFVNKLIIKEEEYECGFFPQIPNYKKRGSAFILTGGNNDDILVDERTTTKQIRQGRYRKLIEISTLPYTKELRFNSVSKEMAYSFDVYVKAVIQVYDPLIFYENRNLDVDSYLDNLFSLDVKKITQKYGILNYSGMDEELKDKLSTYDSLDTTIGFSYRISVVDAVAGEKAQQYVERYGKEQIEDELRKHTNSLIKSLATTYEEAIQQEVIEGKLSQTEAILKIDEYRQSSYNKKIIKYEELLEKGVFTNDEMRRYVVSALETLKCGSQNLIADDAGESGKRDESGMDLFYPGEEI